MFLQILHKKFSFFSLKLDARSQSELQQERKLPFRIKNTESNNYHTLLQSTLLA